MVDKGFQEPTSPGQARSCGQRHLHAQVRTLVQQEMYRALSDYDALISPAAPTTAYKLGEVKDDPLEMYKGDLMTINVNLAGEKGRPLQSRCTFC